MSRPIEPIGPQRTADRIERLKLLDRVERDFQREERERRRRREPEPGCEREERRRRPAGEGETPRLDVRG